MKRAGMIATLVLMMLPVFAAAQQLGPTDHIVVNVPFQFQLGSKMAPAGTYTIRPAVNGSLTLYIQDPAAKFGTAVTALPGESKNSREGYSLIFHKYGDSYFLSGVGLPGTSVRNLPEGKLESELQAKGNVPSIEMVAALR